MEKHPSFLLHNEYKGCWGPLMKCLQDDRCISRNVTRSRESRLLLAVSDSEHLVALSWFILDWPFPASEHEEVKSLLFEWVSPATLPSGELKEALLKGIPISSNNSLLTFCVFAEGGSILNTAICFVRHSESYSAAANCEVIVLRKLCKDWTFLRGNNLRLDEVIISLAFVS